MDLSENKVILNVGGHRFETNKTTLKKIPATRLSRLTEALANYDKILNEYFFDRHPGVFSQILNYYRTGKLHYPTNVCGPLFETELEFWGLDSNQVEYCCYKTYTKHRDTEETLATLEKLEMEEDKTSDADLAKMFRIDEDPRWHDGTLPWYKKLKPIVWQLFNEPNSSSTAKFITYLSVLFIITSILTYCFSTVNDLCKNSMFCRSYSMKLTMPATALMHSSELRDDDACSEGFCYENYRDNVIRVTIGYSERAPTLLDYIEYVCITWFTFEFGIKFAVSPNRWLFFKTITNWIDILCFIWFYLDLMYNYFLYNQRFDTHPAWDLFGTVRIMRLFKLFHHYPGLKIIVASLRASAGILRLLGFFIGVAVIIFASLIYYAEKIAAGSDGRNGMSSIVGSGSLHSIHQDNENQFASIIEAIWFSIASLTTVGFGDYSPKTPVGMAFGALCTVAGVLMIDLPMPIIVENFANYYNHLQAHKKFPKKLRRRLAISDCAQPQLRTFQNFSISIPSTAFRQKSTLLEEEVSKIKQVFSKDKLTE